MAGVSETGSQADTAVAALVENVLSTRFEDLAPELIETMKGRIIDIVGCAIGGADAPGNRELVDLVRRWNGNPEATLLVHGGKVLVQDAAMVNAVLTRSYDFEEQAPMEHQSATVIPVALALGEMVRASGKDLLTALIAGADLGNRISASFDFDFYQGFDNIGSLHTFASAAIAGRFLGLTPFELRNALGIALHQTAGSIASYWDCDTTFKLNNGFAARTGIVAAQFAKAGLLGALDPLHGKYGYYKLYTHGCVRPEKLIEDLGKKYVLGRDMYKQFPCGRPTHVPIELGIALAREHNINPEDIREVVLSLKPRYMTIYYAQPFRIRDYPLADALFSFQYTLACALLRRHVNLTDMTEEAIRDPEINRMVKKIRLQQISPGRDGIEVIIRLNDGREYSKFSDKPDRGLTNREEIKDKFWAQVEFAQRVPPEKAEALLALLENLEDVDDVSSVVALTCAQR